MKVKAKESPQVQRAKKKLEKEMAKEAGRINPEALEKTRSVMKREISRHEADRSKSSDLTVTLWDENKHSEISHNRHVKHLFNELRKAASNEPSPEILKERVRFQP